VGGWIVYGLSYVGLALATGPAAAWVLFIVYGAYHGLSEPAEKALVLKLAGFADAISDVTRTLEPHRLCGYLYELAGVYTSFYEACPVLKAATAQQRSSRLALCALTAATLKRGLGLLGIGVPDRM